VYKGPVRDYLAQFRSIPRGWTPFDIYKKTASSNLDASEVLDDRDDRVIYSLACRRGKDGSRLS